MRYSAIIGSMIATILSGPAQLFGGPIAFPDEGLDVIARPRGGKSRSYSHSPGTRAKRRWKRRRASGQR